MHRLDLDAWPRREHFDLFSAFDYPYFSLCADVDVTAFRDHVERDRLSFNLAVVYAIARAANAVPEFRYRIRDGDVVEHDVVHPSTTIMGADEVFGFCTLVYDEDFPEFARAAAEKIAQMQARPRVTEAGEGRDDLLFMTAIPWVSFTSFMHPLRLSPPDSIPRFAWGRYADSGGHVTLPLSVQGHHAVMDGLHAAKFYAQVQECFARPADVLSGARAPRG